MIEELRTFVLFAEEGSIQKVAQRLPLTQPAVSRQIQRLEQALGVQLLDRRQKPPKLTPTGVDVLARSHEILDGFTRLKAIATTPEPEGVFRLGLVNGLAHHSLAEHIAAVIARFPHVSLRLKSGWSADLAEQHRLGLLDAAILLSDRSRFYDADPIGEEELVTIASPALIARGDPQQSSWVLSPEPCDARRRLAGRLAEQGRALLVAAEIEDAGLQMGLVRQGLGLGLFPKRLLDRTKPEGIEPVEVACANLKLDVLMVRSPHLGSMAKVADDLADEIRAFMRISP
jgi:DNA-binding transcriptional LysR family regulator